MIQGKPISPMLSFASASFFLQYLLNNEQGLGFVEILNYKPKLVELKNLLNIWKQRALSLKGKITIINTLALAPLIYVASLIDIPKYAITEINNIIQHFIWDGKTSTIAQSTLIQSIEHGGLKLCQFETKSKALQLSWVKRLINPTHENWKLLTKSFYNCNNLSTIFSANPI